MTRASTCSRLHGKSRISARLLRNTPACSGARPCPEQAGADQHSPVPAVAVLIVLLLLICPLVLPCFDILLLGFVTLSIVRQIRFLGAACAPLGPVILIRSPA